MAEKSKCGVCKGSESEDDGGEMWIQCEEKKCKQWYHVECLEMDQIPENWLCAKCAGIKSNVGGAGGKTIGANGLSSDTGGSGGAGNSTTKNAAIDSQNDSNADGRTNVENGGNIIGSANQNATGGGDDKKSLSGGASDEDDDDISLKLQLMNNLIKEKEELCTMKEKQLEMMTKFSERKKSKSVKEWVDASNKFGENSKELQSIPQVDSKPREIKKSTKLNISNNQKSIRDKKLNESSTSPAQCPKNEDKNDILHLMKRQMQLMSQQYLQDLPDFDGDADMWPIFHQQYATTTEQGGFDDAFNLIRLRKCLKGEARQAVIGILAMPNCLQDVLSILEKRFGNDDVIVKKKLKKLSNLTSPNENKPQTVRQFYEFLMGFNATLKSANASDYLQSPQTIDIIVEKLPPNITRRWLRFKRDLNGRPTIDDFIKWFEPYYDVAVECDRETKEQSKPEPSNKRNNNRVNMNSEPSTTKSKPNSDSTTVENLCRYCRKADHAIVKCSKFEKLNIRKKWFFVRERKLCFVCLLSRHRNENCVEKKPCGVDGCDKYHHKLLHALNSLTKAAETNDDVETKSEPVLSAVMSSSEINNTHYRILPVTLYNSKNNKSVETWAFLDEGSSPTMLANELANVLELEGEMDELCTTWTDDSVRTDENSRRIKLEICGIGEKRRFTLHNVRTVSQLKLPLPSMTTELIHKYEHLRDLNIPNIPISRPTILIGLEHAKLGLMYEIREGKWNEPVASRTRLGWAIHGKEVGKTDVNYLCHVCECKSTENLTELMRSFYSTEALGVSFQTLIEAKEIVRAREVLESTTKQGNKQYETGLLWKRDDVVLPQSKSMAVKRLLCFEQKLKRDDQLKLAVQSKMNEHIDKGFLVKLSPSEIDGMRHWYLPVFSVVNPNKDKPPRLVFDAAAKSQGLCLNDTLLKGPEMDVSLLGIIMRFRLRAVAVSADIAEMFHRVKIIDRDQYCQLILWRNCDETKPIDTYKMTRMTFGATCSPCSANYVKNKNAEKFIGVYPRAVKSIIQNHYVDDLLDCFDDEKEALAVAQQIRIIHEDAGFYIRNWISNSKMIARELNCADEKQAEVNMNMSEEISTEKVLGLFWRTDTDDFIFKVNVKKVSQDVILKIRLPTKREVLKVIMSQFDPLGFLSPIIIHAKILMQEVWKIGLDWDDQIDENLGHKWYSWLESLNNITDLQIPRCYNQNSMMQATRTILHIMADASEEAFATVAFLQIKYNDEMKVSFVAAKSRVAPQKSLSIPRLELQAAILAIRLKNTIVEEMAIQIDNVVFWTDSQTVLGWIRSSTRKYSAFISHRVSEILDSSTICQWRWLPSKENVADEATRSSDEVPIISSRWLNGPEYLQYDSDCWPKEKEKIVTTNEEARQVINVHCELNQNNLIEVTRFSKWERMLRTMAFVVRFVEVVKKKRRPECENIKIPLIERIAKVPAITPEELKLAEKILYKIVQKDEYKIEIQMLSTGKSISKKSRIYNLNPILDDDGILRLSSRLEAAPSIINEDIRRPIILSRQHRITTLIIEATHRKHHHLNKESVVNEIRQYLWIPKIRVEVNMVIRNECMVCKHRLAKPKVPIMAPLPKSRLSPCQPAFSYTGVDFFGPIEVTVGRRHEKRWGVLFVCLTMRAIHIELSSSLDTNSAIMCVRNFINRRGPPLEMVSDNGTNLRAAETELKKAVKEIDYSRLQNELSSPLPNEVRTKWTFIPPSAPHFGGSWERMIQTVKKSLYMILKEKYPKDETLRSALIEIENLVNSRPLYYSPNDVDTPEAITPNHLLKGTCRQVVPLMGEFDSRKQWRVAQSLANEFWKRFLIEYLPTISRRPKWRDEVDPVQVGQLVLIIDDTVQRGEWRRGIISKVYPSQDGKIRTAEVKAGKRTYLRPVSKLAIIDIGPVM